MPGLGTQLMTWLQKWTQLITRVNLACQQVLCWTRVIYTPMRTQNPTSRHRPPSLGCPPYPLLGNMKKECHETSPSNLSKRQRNVPQRHRARLDNLQARMKRRNNRTYVRFAAKNISKCRALRDITELNTIPVRVCSAVSN